MSLFSLQSPPRVNSFPREPKYSVVGKIVPSLLLGSNTWNGNLWAKKNSVFYVLPRINAENVYNSKFVLFFRGPVMLEVINFDLSYTVKHGYLL